MAELTTTPEAVGNRRRDCAIIAGVGLGLVAPTLLVILGLFTVPFGAAMRSPTDINGIGVSAVLLPVLVTEEDADGFLAPSTGLTQDLPPILELRGCKKGDQLKLNADGSLTLRRADGTEMQITVRAAVNQPLPDRVILKDDHGNQMAAYALDKIMISDSVRMLRQAEAERQRDHPNGST